MAELACSPVNLVTLTGDFWDVYYLHVLNAKQTFAERGMTFPYPQLSNHLEKEES